MTRTTGRPRKPPTTTPVKPTIYDSEIIDEMDTVLDAIDEVLEENAVEIIRSYRQKGGE